MGSVRLLLDTHAPVRWLHRRSELLRAQARGRPSPVRTGRSWSAARRPGRSRPSTVSDGCRRHATSRGARLTTFVGRAVPCFRSRSITRWRRVRCPPARRTRRAAREKRWISPARCAGVGCRRMSGLVRFQPGDRRPARRGVPRIGPDFGPARGTRSSDLQPSFGEPPVAERTSVNERRRGDRPWFASPQARWPAVPNLAGPPPPGEPAGADRLRPSGRP